MPKKLIKIMTTIVLLLVGLLIVILGIQQSDFSKIKKYNQGHSGSGGCSSLSASGGTDKTRHDRTVKIEGENMANLGDFNFNVAGGKMLLANITLKYKANEDYSPWYKSKETIESEIIRKSTLLRDAAINTMIGNERATIDSYRLRKELKKSLNKNLSTGEVQEVYFNKFILQ